MLKRSINFILCFLIIISFSSQLEEKTAEDELPEIVSVDTVN